MRLTVTYPADEFERDEYPNGDHTRETADAHLATMPRGWLEATLREDGEIAWRRFPASSWVAVKHWPLSPTERDRRDIDVDTEALESWLRAIGVRVRWDVLKRHPFPGHAVNRDALEPDHYARVSQRKGSSAIHAVLSALIGEGMDYGVAQHLVNSGCEHRRADRAKFMDALHAETFALRNEVRRLKGEPEMTEEQEQAEGRERVREWVAATIARKSAQWRLAPVIAETRDHHRAHADADGRSWWKVRRPTHDLIAADATGYVCVTAHDCGVYAFAAGDGTPTIAGKSDATLWSEWSPVAGWYGDHVAWPEARPDGLPELSQVKP